jgi:hypothetical protein
MYLNLEEKEIYLLPGLLAILLVMLVGYLVFRRLKKTRTKRKIKRVMRKLSHEMVSNIMLPDGTGNFVHFDYLLLTPKGVIVVDIKDYTGFLFGGENMDQWTQMIKRKSYKFENPLHHNQTRVAVVKNMVGNVPVLGYVVFTNVGRFPKGSPVNTYMLDNIREDTGLKRDKSKLSSSFLQAWDVLKGAAVDEVPV